MCEHVALVSLEAPAVTLVLLDKLFEKPVKRQEEHGKEGPKKMKAQSHT